MTNHEYILRVLRCVNPYECDDILWVVDGDKVNFQVNCNDAFWWATADCEDVTPENIGELERAYADVGGVRHAQMLFAARVRQMRPQNAAYPKDKSLWPLFDACGPERDDDKTKRPA